jgi:hypothetical protein
MIQCLWVSPGAYPRVKQEKHALASRANIRRGWKGFLWINALAYLSVSDEEKSFVILVLGAMGQCYTILYICILWKLLIKRECLTLLGLSGLPMFVGYPRSPPKIGASLAYPTNIRLGWKGISGINTLAYLASSSVKKSFITLVSVLRLFNSRIIVSSLNPGTLTEREGSVHLTSSLRLVVL